VLSTCRSTNCESALIRKSTLLSRQSRSSGSARLWSLPDLDTRRAKLVTLASHYAVPTMYHFREFAAAGGLVSYAGGG
jgi:hypothetical protein